MIPIVMDDKKDLTELAEDYTNGLGQIDCLSAVVREERNGQYTAELLIPISNKYFYEIAPGGIIKIGTPYGPDLFRVSKIRKSINDTAQISLNHISYDLNKTVLLPFRAVGLNAIAEAFNTMNISRSPFNMRNKTGDDTFATFEITKPTYYREALGQVLEEIGAAVETNGDLTVRYKGLDVKLEYDTDNTSDYQIAYGYNLIDFNQEEAIANLYDAVIGYATNKESGVQIISDMIYTTVTIPLYPKTAILDANGLFEEGETITKVTIEEKIASFILSNNLTKPEVTIDLKHIQLSQTEDYKRLTGNWPMLGDKIKIIFEKLYIETEAKIISYEYDPLQDRYTDIKIGRPQQTIEESIKQYIGK